MRFGLLVSSFNHENYIEQCLASIDEQIVTFDEVVVVDDHSEDSTWEKIQAFKFLRTNNVVKIRNENNKGLMGIINDHIGFLNVDYFCRIDADDYLSKWFLQTHKMALVNNNNNLPTIIYSDYFLVDETGVTIGSHARKTDDTSIAKILEPIHGACVSILLSEFMKLGGYNPSISRQDGVDVWLKLAKGDHYHINLPLFYYRQHGKNISQISEPIIENRNRLFREHFKKSGDVLAVLSLKEDLKYSGKDLQNFALSIIDWATKLSNLDEVKKIVLLAKSETIDVLFLHYCDELTALGVEPKVRGAEYDIFDIFSYLVEVNKMFNAGEHYDQLLLVNPRYSIHDLEELKTLISVSKETSAKLGVLVNQNKGLVFRYKERFIEPINGISDYFGDRPTHCVLIPACFVINTEGLDTKANLISKICFVEVHPKKFKKI